MKDSRSVIHREYPDIEAAKSARSLRCPSSGSHGAEVGEHLPPIILDKAYLNR
jgi:hypothetical protein